MLSISECDDFFESSMGYGDDQVPGIIQAGPDSLMLALKAGIIFQSPDITMLMQNFFTNRYFKEIPLLFNYFHLGDPA